MAKSIADAHDAFEDGSDLSDEEQRLLNHAFEVRMVMSDALSALAVEGLDVSELAQAIDVVDEVHAGHGSATLLVDDELHDLRSSRKPSESWSSILTVRAQSWPTAQRCS